MKVLLFPFRLVFGILLLPFRALASIFGLGRRTEVEYDEVDDDDYEDGVDVVGESHHQKDLWKIVGQPTDNDGPVWSGEATLEAERRNPHDANAIKVTINGKTVGYLDRSLSAILHRPLLALGGKRKVPSVAKGGYQLKNGKRAALGIVLQFRPSQILKK